MINAMEEKRMVQVEEYLLPMAFARAVDVDSTFAYMGSLMTFLAKGSETGGRFALMEYHTRTGNEPPPHVHEREHELTLCWKAQCASTAKTRLWTSESAVSYFFPRVRHMRSPALLMSYAR